MSKILDRLLADPRVETVSNEARGGDGYWVYLKYGWQRGDLPPSKHDKPGGSNQHLHTVHEWSIRELRAAMREVSPCTCWECTRGGEP